MIRFWIINSNSFPVQLPSSASQLFTADHERLEMSQQKKHDEKFLFVNLTDDPDVGSLRHRRLVHSHVSQFRWQQSRSRKAKSSGRVREGSRRTTVDFERHLEEAKTKRMQAASSMAMTTATRQSSFANMLDEGLLDPFQTYSNSFYTTHQVHNAMSYALKTMWPGLLPQVNVETTWFPEAIAEPILFSACMYGAEVHMQSHKTILTDSAQHEVNRSANETIRRLQPALDGQRHSMSDQVLLTVLTLAFDCRRLSQQVSSNTDSDSRRPLQDLQWLAMYSSLPVNQVHVDGLGALLSMDKNSFHGRRLPGLAALISYSDILLASRQLRKPSLPFVPLIQEAENLDFVDLPQDQENLATIISPNMSLTLMKMHGYNAMLAYYLAGNSQSPGLAYFADARNQIQHDLLSLPQGDQLDATIVPGFTAASTAGYELMRISLLLYSLIVIFPIPFRFGPFVQLRVLLRGVLTKPDTYRRLPNAVILWSLTIGSIVPVPEDKDWFETKLNEIMSWTKVSSVEELKVVLKSIMWQETVLDPLLGKVRSVLRASE